LEIFQNFSNFGLVAHVADGSTKSETTPARHLLTSGDRPLDAVIMDERRDDPRWLCNDYDDMPKQNMNRPTTHSVFYLEICLIASGTGQTVNTTLCGDPFGHPLPFIFHAIALPGDPI